LVSHHPGTSLPSIPPERLNANETIVSETNRPHTDLFVTGVNVLAPDITFHGDGVCLSGLQAQTLPLTPRDMVDDPIRLGNSDLASFELHSRTAMYGSVPLVVAHAGEWHAGAVWLNSSEQSINI
jgi:alpha 1,3-glucosidase